MRHSSKINLSVIIRILVILGIILGIFFVFLTCSGGSFFHRIDKTLPDAKIAPWEVTTPTHLYYAESTNRTPTGVAMTGWYEKVKGKWILHKDTIHLDYKIYGVITVGRR